MKNNSNKKVILIASICLSVLIVLLLGAFYSMNMTIMNGNLKASVNSEEANTYSSNSNMLIIGDSRMVGMANNSRNKASYVAVVGGHYQGTYGVEIDSTTRVTHMKNYMKKIVSNKGFARVFVVATVNDYKSGDPTSAINAQINVMKTLRTYANNNNIGNKVKIYGCSLIPEKGYFSKKYNETLQTKLKTAKLSYLAIRPQTINYEPDGVHFKSSTARDIYNIMNTKTSKVIKTTVKTTKKVTTTTKKTTNTKTTVKTKTSTSKVKKNCTFAAKSTNNSIILTSKCTKNAYARIINLKVKNGSLIGKKQVSKKNGTGTKVFKFSNIPVGSYFISVKYTDANNKQKVATLKQIDVKGKNVDFYGENNNYSLISRSYNEKTGLKYTFKGDTNVNAPFMILVWNDNNEKCRIYYSKTSPEKIQNTSFDVIVNDDILSKNCGSSTQNNGDLKKLVHGDKYHIILYWNTKKEANKTGFDYFIKSFIDEKVTYK